MKKKTIVFRSTKLKLLATKSEIGKFIWNNILNEDFSKRVIQSKESVTDKCNSTDTKDRTFYLKQQQKR